jgi:hypothetical protein
VKTLLDRRKKIYFLFLYCSVVLVVSVLMERRYIFLFLSYKNEEVVTFYSNNLLFAHVNMARHVNMGQLSHSTLSIWFKSTCSLSARLLSLILPYTTHFSSIFPTAWMVSKVIPIAKISDSPEPKDYRTISILPALFEVVKRDQIVSFFNSGRTLDRFQKVS